MNIAVFCSGNGSNFQAIIDSVNKGDIKANIALVVCDNFSAFALRRASEAGIKSVVIDRKAFPVREDFEKEIVRNLKREKVELICLAGFMRLMSVEFVQKYRHRILNIHPALLPAFKGMQGIKDAFEYGVNITGVTVHFVDEKTDHGPIILQEAVAINADDTVESLSLRIHEVEHKLYPEAVRLFVEGKLVVKGRKVIIC